MILDLREIQRSGKESQTFFFEYTPSENLVSLPEVQMLLPIKVEGEVTLTGNHTAYVEGEVCFSLKGECTRCLTQTENQYVAQFEEEIDADNPESYPIVNDKIDLTKIVYDAVIMNMPINFLCREDCLGLCPQCGGNLNDGECKCKNK